MAIIYGLICEHTNKIYVGCTAAKINKRFREHRCLLNNGKHNEKDLQADWQQYGAQSFRMVKLDDVPPPCGPAEKRKAETSWMDRLDAEGRLYNRNRQSFALLPENAAKGVAASIGVPGKRWTPEANLKRRLSQLGRPKGHGAKISATKQAKKLAMMMR